MYKRVDILLCFGSGCVSAGARGIKEELQRLVRENKIDNEVNIIETGCMGPCDYGPLMLIYPEGVFYKKLTPEDMKEVVEEHLIKGRVVERLLMHDDTVADRAIRNVEDVPFYKNQTKVALKYCGYLNPESLEEYVAVDGYSALGKVLEEMKPEDVINEIKISGIRGRGGGGFPTHLKWSFARSAKSEDGVKYMICNGDEGDPGAFMDRSLLEGDPHRVLEGMMIGAYAIGASKGYFYIRAEYPLAIERIKLAISKAREYGLIGDNILGSDFCFDAEVRTGAGAFVCGEETALISSIEGKRGHPKPKPPFPANKGLWDKPSNINNVETFANISSIILNGGQWFASMGTEKSKGTKVFALTGDVKNTGLVEVPMGITIGELIDNVGGGISKGNFKAVQLGGPSGGCLTKEHWDVPIDYDSLTAKGAMMGSGGVIVMNDSKCMVNVAKFFLEFSLEESCGKCSPCRVGLKHMHNILEKITSGQGCMEDLDELESVGKLIKATSLCGLGQSAPNPVLSTMKYFRNEYEAHIKDKRCDALVCTELLHFNINKDKCVGCSLCAKKCPVNCISGSREEKFDIAQDACIKCGNCHDVCPVKAVEKLAGKVECEEE